MVREDQQAWVARELPSVVANAMSPQGVLVQQPSSVGEPPKANTTNQGGAAYLFDR